MTLPAVPLDWASQHEAVLKERENTRIFQVAWHEAMRTVTHLNNALRRKNRRIKRQKEIIARLRQSASPREDPPQ